ncbi:MAG: phosphodiester glycosidase family protein [Clostridia bacterium]|nr:phosphodiester glycosidase family protein [Clostridia bacterium]
MRKLLSLLLALTLLLPAFSLAEEEEVIENVQFYDPLTVEDAAAPYAPHQEDYLPNNGGYHDDSLDITVETFYREDTLVWAVHVKLTDASQFRTGLAGKYPSKKVQRVSEMAKRYNAVLAINGDYFSHHSQGIVVRNGKLLRNRPHKGRDTLIVDNNGDFTIIQQTTKKKWEAYEGTVMHAFCFGPGLVVNGEALTSLKDVTIDLAKGKKTQRMAIGQLGKLEYLILACEGPEQKGSKGMTLLEFAQLCKDMGCINAYNLDGGSSTSIVLNDAKINGLSSGKIRSVGDCIYFATLVP